jgi:hypothetical protein
MANYFLLVGTIIAGIFFALLLMQYVKRRKMHQLIWTVAVGMYFLAFLLEFLSSPDFIGGNVWMYKVFYVISAPLVGLFGAGSLHLLTHKPWGKYFLVYVIIISIAMIAAGLSASVDEGQLTSPDFEGIETIAGAAMPQYVRYFSPLLTVPGGIFLIGGAAYSFWLDKTRKYNLLIALGGLFPFLGGALARAEMYDLFYALDVLGALLLFIGFLMSMEYIRKTVETAPEEEPDEKRNIDELKSD